MLKAMMTQEAATLAALRYRKLGYTFEDAKAHLTREAYGPATIRRVAAAWKKLDDELAKQNEITKG